MKAILQYMNSWETNLVFGTLAENNIEIIKTKGQFDPKIVIRIENIDTLNILLVQLNNNTSGDVKVIKIKSERTFFERIKDFFR